MQKLPRLAFKIDKAIDRTKLKINRNTGTSSTHFTFVTKKRLTFISALQPCPVLRKFNFLENVILYSSNVDLSASLPRNLGIKFSNLCFCESKINRQDHCSKISWQFYEDTLSKGWRIGAI